MIVLFTPGGRTGNQLFQVAYAVSQRRRTEWLLTLGFGETRALLAGAWKRRWVNLDNTLLRGLVERYAYPVIYHGLVKTGLACSHYGRRAGFVIRPGKIRRLTIMKGFFETSQRLSPALRTHFRLRNGLRQKARDILSSLPDGSVPVFVHIRRSDMMSFTGKGPDPRKALPDAYYLKGVSLFQRHHPGAYFIIVGDDPEHAETLFKDLNQKFVSRLSVSDDLALMSLCDGGVLSNSTLAWWGAFFGNRRHGYVAPLYWSGWNVRQWHPPEIHASFMTNLIDIHNAAGGTG